ncbi:unnamed protein product [Eruca vesicaria subsp. sativa]|uniref:Protein kinase domain-containing protein n=1 Tax=Eruca vesicaria subsp. sativa TaxID=29727 RepID=A0ABC8LHM1_ERUVS|nr:unnamed protein product [Eruca vesicaria subsp. sativa]
MSTVSFTASRQEHDVKKGDELMGVDMVLVEKRLISALLRDLDSFILTKIDMLSQFKHINLVPLIGYCNVNIKMIVVYEYMEKETLKNHMYDLDNPSSTRAIIHRIVKSANILLNKNFMAEVAEFGLSKPAPYLNQTPGYGEQDPISYDLIHDIVGK